MRAFVTPMVSTAHADVCWLDNQSIGKMPMTLPNGHQLLGHQAHHASYRYCSEEFLFYCTQFLLCDAKVILLAPSRSICLQHVMHKEWASLCDCKCNRLVSMWWLTFLGNTKSVQPGSPTWSSSLFTMVEAIKLISCSLLAFMRSIVFLCQFFFNRLTTQSCVMTYLRQTCSCSWLPSSHSRIHSILPSDIFAFIALYRSFPGPITRSFERAVRGRIFCQRRLERIWHDNVSNICSAIKVLKIR